MQGIGLQSTNGSLIMIVVTPPNYAKNLLEESKIFHSTISKIKLDSKDTEDESVKRGTLSLNCRCRATYSLFNQDLYIVVYFNSTENPFISSHYLQASQNVIKQVVKNIELPSHPQIDKKFFEVHMALSGILDGVDMSAVDVSSPKFLEDLEKFSVEEIRIFRQAKVFTNELQIDPVDLEDLGDNIAVESLDKTNILSEMEEFYQKNPKFNEKPSARLFGESFSPELLSTNRK